MANDNNNIQPASGENNQIVIYTTADGKVNLEVQIDANTVWLTQQQICLLYGKAKSTISEHLTHIFEEGELDPQVVVRENRTTTQHGAIEGKTQENITRFYNLDAILAVGFRVRSGTSIGANVMESQHAQSDADFLSKMQIALKEANETEYWLNLLHNNGYLNDEQYSSIHNDCVRILKILNTIVRTTRNKIGK